MVLEVVDPVERDLGTPSGARSGKSWLKMKDGSLAWLLALILSPKMVVAIVARATSVLLTHDGPTGLCCCST